MDRWLKGGHGERNRNRFLLFFVAVTQRILLILFYCKYNHVSVPWEVLLLQGKGISMEASPLFYLTQKFTHVEMNYEHEHFLLSNGTAHMGSALEVTF